MSTVTKADIEKLLKDPTTNQRLIPEYRKKLEKPSTDLAKLQATIQSQATIPRRPRRPVSPPGIQSPPFTPPLSPSGIGTSISKQPRIEQISSAPNVMDRNGDSKAPAASGPQGASPAASGLQGASPAASGPQAASRPQAATSGPQGASPAASRLKGTPSAAEQGASPAASGPQGASPTASGLKGTPSAASGPKGTPSAASEPQGASPATSGPQAAAPGSQKVSQGTGQPLNDIRGQPSGLRRAMSASAAVSGSPRSPIVSGPTATPPRPAPAPGGPPGAPPPGGDPNAAMANATAMGMAYGGPLAGMMGPANAGALLQAQGDLKQLLDARTLPITLMLPLIIALIAIILGFVVSVYYVILLIVMVIQQSAINAPLNIETVDYASIQSLTFFTPGQFNYTYFLLLPLVAIAAIGIFTALATVVNPAKAIPREIKGLVFIIGLSAVIMFFLQYLIYKKVGATITAVDKRLRFFNTYVCTKIYKNSLFLKNLENPQASIVGVHNTIQNSLQMVTEGTGPQDMAKAFFTLTMFYHYQKISLRNPIIFDAFNLFNTRTLLSRQCQPGAYLSRYGTYIEDITETLIRPQLPKSIKMGTINQAFILCNEWITNANGYANTIYPEDSFSSFVIMAILTILIQMVPLYLIIKFYQEGQDATSRILRALMENLGVTTTKAEQQTIRM